MVEVFWFLLGIQTQRKVSNMKNWKTEYKVDFHILALNDGKKEIEYNSLIIEGTSPDNAEQLVKAQFSNVIGFKIDKITTIYKSPRWPDRNLPFYVNIVLKIQTRLNPYELLKILNIIETKMGRKRKHKNEPIICDIDILDYDKMIINQNYINII